MYIKTQYRRERDRLGQKKILERIVIESFPDFISKHQPVGPRSSGNCKRRSAKEKHLDNANKNADNLR